tara:strand:- start:61 stop:597 length:537 start_codon:yes stop_codon:yes gene_type:complete
MISDKNKLLMQKLISMREENTKNETRLEGCSVWNELTLRIANKALSDNSMTDEQLDQEMTKINEHCQTCEHPMCQRYFSNYERNKSHTWNSQYPVTKNEYDELDDAQKLQLDLLETIKGCGLPPRTIVDIFLGFSIDLSKSTHLDNSIQALHDELELLKNQPSTFLSDPYVTKKYLGI